jgi:membrane-associated protease RseP (regulator of RpoE activity)
MNIILKRFFRGLRVPLLLSATLLICVTVHEIGHALATIATGGRVKEFSVLGFRPHVSVQGKFTDAQKAVRSAAGSGTFLAMWTLFIVSLPRCRSRFFEIKAATAFFAFIEVLGWTLASLQYPHGPRSDDPWKFISLTGLSPQIVTITCMATMGLIWYLYRSRTRLVGASA